MSAAAGAELWNQPILVFQQRGKLVELTNEYRILDADGNEVGRARQVGQSPLRKVLRLVSDLDAALPIRLQVTDAAGQPQLELWRGFTVLRSRVRVTDAATGGEVGVISQRNVVGKARFDLLSDGAELGTLRAENWRAWNFTITDAAGQEAARVTKRWAGLAKEMFTTADTYALEVVADMSPSLRRLTVASALAIDTALKQRKG